MTGDPSIPGLSFDPREVSPADIVSARVEQVRAFVARNERILIGVAAAIVIAQILIYAEYGIVFLTIPRLPNWLLVGIGAVIFMAPWALFMGWLLGRGLYRDESVLISVLNPQSGDQTLKRLDPGRWEDVRVVNQNGEERQRSYLARVAINGEQAIEVDRYDSEDNIAIASGMAGRTNNEVRQDRSLLLKIKTDLEEQADAAMNLLTTHSTILREQGKEVSMSLIKAAEKVEVPQAGDLHERLTETIEEHDNSEDLMGDLHGVEEREELDEDLDLDGPEDIFDRARETAQDGAEAVRTDGGDPDE